MLPTLRRRSTTVDNPLDLFRRDLDVLRQDFSRVFGSWMPELGEENGGAIASYPVDVHEEDSQVVVEAEMPGFKKSEIDVSVDNGVLHISAERNEETKKGKAHLHERRFTKVERSLVLPAEVDDTKATAKFENGVLHMTLPKTGESKQKKITIS